MRTSYSAIETFHQCPQRYKFQNIDRIRVPKSREALFGSLIHGTLQYMFQRDPLFPTLDEVIEHFRANWPAQETLMKEVQHDPLKTGWTEEEQKIYFEEGVRMLKKFYEKNAPWNFTVLDLESRFEVVIEDEKTKQTHILAGIIDRIDKKPDETYEIIDYKTSKRMPSQEALDRNLQLSFYALGLQKRWPHLKPEEISLSLYFVKHGEKLTTKATAEITEKAKQHVLNTIAEIQEKIASNKSFEPMPGPLCNWCGYKPMCPAWRHLYCKIEADKGAVTQEDVDVKIAEYFDLKKKDKQNDTRMKELQEEIRDYMSAQGLTRVFGDDGVLAQKTVQRYAYDWEKVKALLEPLGKWEEILKADETKLKRILKEIPEATRLALEDTRSVAKEYSMLTASPAKPKKGFIEELSDEPADI